MPWLVVSKDNHYGRGLMEHWFDLLAEPAPTVGNHFIYGERPSHIMVLAPPDPNDHGPYDTTRLGTPRLRPPSRKATPMVDKPPFAIPTMPEIATLKGTTGLTAVSTFSGCGGSCLGLEWAGFDVRWASEFVPAAADVYRLNHPSVPVDERDIRTVTPDEILTAAGIEPGTLDLLEGSPPCASFSTAGSRDKGWGQVKQYSDTKQRTDDLFYEYARLLRGLQPRAFVAENVSGLVKGKAKGYFKLILAELRDCGYRVGAKVLDAQWLGVPQRRQRLIFVGFRNDLDIDPVFPTPLPYRYTVSDALPWIAPANGYGPPPDAPTDDELADVSIDGYAIAADRKRMLRGSAPKYLNSDLAYPDKPAPTVTQTGGTLGAAAVMLAHEPRKFTIGELRRICGFPDDFQLTGTYQQQWERLGRSVPPPMMYAVAREIADALR